MFLSKHGDKKILADVYYILDLKSNIISLGQATESECEVRMKEDYLTLHDKMDISSRKLLGQKTACTK